MCRVRTGNLSVSFVVVDNATDDTPAVLREFARHRRAFFCYLRPALTTAYQGQPGKCPGARITQAHALLEPDADAHAQPSSEDESASRSFRRGSKS